MRTRRSLCRSERSSPNTRRSSSHCRSTRRISTSPNLKGILSATQIAEEIRARIRAETELTASAAISYNRNRRGFGKRGGLYLAQVAVDVVAGEHFAYLAVA